MLNCSSTFTQLDITQCNVMQANQMRQKMSKCQNVIPLLFWQTLGTDCPTLQVTSDVPAVNKESQVLDNYTHSANI